MNYCSRVRERERKRERERIKKSGSLIHFLTLCFVPPPPPVFPSFFRLLSDESSFPHVLEVPRPLLPVLLLLLLLALLLVLVRCWSAPLCPSMCITCMCVREREGGGGGGEEIIITTTSELKNN